MLAKRKFDVFLLLLFFLFSWWLMCKSFRYDAVQHEFKIARHEVGDFGLHLSLIRSVSWGNNFPTELPFFPGKPIPYHYYMDLLVGLLERLGVRIDIALNAVSALAFTALLYIIYLFPQRLFGKSKRIGVISVLLFIFHNNLTFIDFFKLHPISKTFIRDVWYLPDYIHKGPFDGSPISIFFTLNVFLNQRHLIAGLATGLLIVYMFLPGLLGKKNVSLRRLITLGIVLALSMRIHSLIFASTALVVFLACIVYKRFNWLVPVLLPSLMFGLLNLPAVVGQEVGRIKNIFNPGFLAVRPLTIWSFLWFWIQNLGVAVLLIPFGVWKSNQKQRALFFCFLTLFVIANAFQLSFRIDHNHSLLNYFILVANFYIAYVLYCIWKKTIVFKISAVILLFFLTISGVIDFMPVKNDFLFPVADAPKNTTIQWIKDHTDKKAIFLAQQQIFDPVTLAGRYNYFGHTYYLSVMGYDTTRREQLTKRFFEAKDDATVVQMKKEKIDYIIIPRKPVIDFPYHTNAQFLDANLRKVFVNDDVAIYQL